MNNTVTLATGALATGALAAQTPEWQIYPRALLALLFVISLIYISSALARKYGLDRRIAGVKGRESTMSIAETLYLDPRRKLMLIKVGEKEHLLLLSPTGDMVVHSSEVRGRHDTA